MNKIIAFVSKTSGKKPTHAVKFDVITEFKSKPSEIQSIINDNPDSFPKHMSMMIDTDED